MSGIQTQLDGSTLVVRMLMRCQRRGGRRRIVALDGSLRPRRSRSRIVDSSRPSPARRRRRMLEDGEYSTLAEMADAERISRSYVVRVLHLTLLAPDIVERILAGRPTIGLPQLFNHSRGLGEQRERFY